MLDYRHLSKIYDSLHGQEQLKKYGIAKRIIDKENLKIKTWLDVGSGTGLAQEFFNKEGITFYCIEPCMEMIVQHLYKARPGVIIKKHVEELNFSENSFDIITAFTSLHHVLDLEKLIRTFENWAKDIIIISMFKKSKKYSEFINIIKHKNLSEFYEDEKDIIVAWHPSK